MRPSCNNGKNIKGDEFQKMGNVFDGHLKEWRRSGQEESVTHKEPLTVTDWDLPGKFFYGVEF